jgi:hypothetical protein
MNCGTCFHGHFPYYQNSTGECHRYPPGVYRSEGYKTITERNWPTIQKHDWCGEHPERKKKVMDALELLKSGG